MNKLHYISQDIPWVSEWRIERAKPIEKKYGFKYRITNGGVYTLRKDKIEAHIEMLRNLRLEKREYLLFHYKEAERSEGAEGAIKK